MSARLSLLRVGLPTSLLVGMLHLGTAYGDPAPTPDVTGAPIPGNESGQTWNDEAEPNPSRAMARGVLAIPKALVWVVLLPIRGGLWVYDRYDLNDRYYNTFYNAERTFGIVPTIEYATGFGLMFGGKLISTDTFGGHERLTALGAYGGTYQDRAEASLDSGTRLDPVVLKLGGNFDRFARLPFYGIGNADESPQPAMLIDPLINDTAVESFYRYQEMRAALDADWRMLWDLHLVGHGALTSLTFDPSTRDPSINTVYNPMDLVGFNGGVKHAYGQLELRVDRRRIARTPWETTQYTTGWLASGFVGGVHGFDNAHDFAHYAVDLQAFIHFALGPRILWLRFRGEGVSGNLNNVPFVELPYLGGDLLRGYNFARFRDRVSGLGTAQYMWDVSRNVDAHLFVDVGRVFGSLNDVSLDNLRVGYGGGISIHTATDFLLAATLASSIDGGLFATATLNAYWNEVTLWR